MNNHEMKYILEGKKPPSKWSPPEGFYVGLCAGALFALPVSLAILTYWIKS